MTEMKMEITLTDMDDISPQKLERVVDLILKNATKEAETGMKERGALDTGRLVSTIQARRRGKGGRIIAVGPSVRYAEFADKFGRKPSSEKTHGGQFIKRTLDFLKTDALPKIIDIVLAKEYPGGS